MAAFIPASVYSQAEVPLVVVLTADGPLTPAMQEYLSRGLRYAEQNSAELLIFELNTPGGSVTLMSEIVKAIRASDIPVVVYVSPRGGMAASAGTVITLAGHAAAMAPETAIGAASPVGSEGEDLGETMEAKEKEILKAQVRALAKDRGEEAVKLAEETIQSAKAVSVSEALQIGLVDFEAQDLDDLLIKLDGFQVSTLNGTRSLRTSGVVVNRLPQSFIEQFLDTLTDPNIVFLLIAIGVQAILIEISSPGGWVAGFIGVICLALATYGLGIITVNWFGIIFLATAFVLFILDIKAPTHGALTAAGVGSLIVGSLVLFNTSATPSFQRVSVPLVVGTSIITGLIFFGIMLFAIRAQKSPIRTGMESLVGRVGYCRTPLNPSGMVQVASELWSATLVEGEEFLAEGSRVEVVTVEGLRLLVRGVK
ncbi:MAG: nodulation protein NfeD [Anaerolineales bacterium]|nr:nodulation protein NfeD [Anaerolineales bacterium]